MRIPRVYTRQFLHTHTSLALNESASHYLSRVLRLQPGRAIELFNGEGGHYTGVITSVGKKQVEVSLDNFVADNRQSSLVTELAIGVSRGERMDYVLQKATELGVSRIVPLVTERTEVKLAGERADKKIQHWQQVIISACEQCQRNILPELAAPTNLSEYLPACAAECKRVLHHRGSTGLTGDTAPASVALLIGPEGGLSNDEIGLAEAQGFAPLTLGPRVLRTETAPLAALAIVQYQWGDLR